MSPPPFCAASSSSSSSSGADDAKTKALEAKIKELEERERRKDATITRLTREVDSLAYESKGLKVQDRVKNTEIIAFREKIRALEMQLSTLEDLRFENTTLGAVAHNRLLEVQRLNGEIQKLTDKIQRFTDIIQRLTDKAQRLTNENQQLRSAAQNSVNPQDPEGHYERLGLTPEDLKDRNGLALTEAKIQEKLKEQYHKYAKMYHTDKFSGMDSIVQEMMKTAFQEMKASYEFLKKPENRRSYGRTPSAPSNPFWNASSTSNGSESRGRAPNASSYNRPGASYGNGSRG